MKVRIALTVEVDPDQWHAVYGNGSSAAEVRKDVQQWATQTILSHPDDLIDPPGTRGSNA